MSTSAPVDHDDSNMKCMEVWGGNGSRENHFVRPGLDIWIRSQAISDSEAGGSDLYLLSSCSSGRITRMIVADICGQGYQYADLVEELRDLIKKNINVIRHTKIVSEISRRLAASSESGCFATTMVSTYFSPTRSFSLCNTGHPPPLLFRHNEQQWSVLNRLPGPSVKNSEPQPLPDELTSITEYQHYETKLSPSDMVLCYSEALTECQNSAGRTLGVNGLLERVRQLNWRDPSKLVRKLVEGIQSEFQDNLSIDDSTVLLCKATKTSVPWMDNLLAPLRYIQGATDKTKIR